MTNDFNNLLEEDLAGRSLSVGQIVDGTVVQISEDGVFVDIGAKSEGHLELDQIFQEELGKLQVGHEVKVRIIKKVDGEFKLSKKSVDFEEAWKKLLEDKENNRDIEIVVREKVKNGYMATAYDILEGFIHHTNFHGKPNMGQGYNSRILDLNRKARKLVFTRRDILDKERDEALERDYGVLQEGMVIEGVVDKLSPYGAFVKITDNLTGLLHISEFSFEHVKKPSEVLKAGEVVQVKILTIDKEKSKISLSRKATLKDPLMMLLPGEELDGKVESLAEFGIFVKLDNGITGLVHVSELSFKKFDHPSDLFKPGDPIRVKVLKVQVEDRRVSLSAKACERDPWTEVYGKFGIGQAVTGTITQLLQSGVVLKLDEFFEAFIPISEISEDRINHPGDVLNEGDEASGVILSIDSSKRRIRVSLRKTEADVAEEKTKVKVPEVGKQDFGDRMSTSAGKVTLGDILKGKLDLTAVSKKEEEAGVAEEETDVEEIEVVAEAAEEVEVKDSQDEADSSDSVVEVAAADEPADAEETASEEAEEVVAEPEVTEDTAAVVEEATETEDTSAEAEVEPVEAAETTPEESADDSDDDDEQPAVSTEGGDLPRMILGITGGISTGKTTASNVIAAKGVRIIDCDEISHYLTGYDTTIITAIREHFGGEMFNKYGSLNRTSLAAVVFNDETERKALERILHPTIKAIVQANIEISESTELPLVIVAPLLIEAGMTMFVDRLWVVSCSSESQLERLCRRSNISRDDALKWIESQMSLTEKEKYADVVISNDGSIDDLVVAVENNWQEFIGQS